MLVIDKEFNKKLMKYNLIMMNAQLDYILSGEWRKEHETKEPTEASSNDIRKITQ